MKVKNSDFEVFYIGFEDDTVVGRREALRQFEALKKYNMALIGKDGAVISWKDIDMQLDNSLMNVIFNDRKRRVDNGIYMADRPPFMVITIDKVSQSVARLEFYAGHDRLELIYDLRCTELEKEDLEPNYSEDTQCQGEDESLKLLRRRGAPQYVIDAFKGSHDRLISMEISYLKVRQTITIQEHQKQMDKALKEILSKSSKPPFLS